ncbi:DUF3791 domain-containing protein [Olsenella sp. YH-ols2217]|uniref:DUF3791 domain-containing protein n=1 Tax=Kribbibacterium absianum TaxID=3044210 RepID=A0ABT6ZLE4_9ACTN|nr:MULTISPECIES: DUF3791 domain-containing protein [unclassified Olsenella]MDJ1121864.1 DUF3791 domain-containing protein [Olsenella sp. YH-ols2216]MDJ1129872.1 DUF3791 domain-containing protein [Olsenella sp. YH-ols2217]
MSKEGAFFAYLLEHYAEDRGRTAPDVLRQWQSLGVDGLIFDMYEIYHVERLENAYEDIDAIVAERLARP